MNTRSPAPRGQRTPSASSTVDAACAILAQAIMAMSAATCVKIDELLKEMTTTEMDSKVMVLTLVEMVGLRCLLLGFRVAVEYGDPTDFLPLLLSKCRADIAKFAPDMDSSALPSLFGQVVTNYADFENISGSMEDGSVHSLDVLESQPPAAWARADSASLHFKHQWQSP